jgi:hypothetical protein
MSGPLVRGLRAGAGGVLEYLSQLPQCVVPGIPLVRHEALQQAERPRLRVGRLILKHAGHCRAMSEAAICELDADFEVGIAAAIYLAKQLQDQLLSIKDRAVALFGRHRSGRQVVVGEGCQ